MKYDFIRKALIFGGFTVGMFILTGCPFGCYVPIDDGTAVFSSKLAGTWISTAESESENPTYFEISLIDNYHASAKKMEYDTYSLEYAETNYFLTLSDVDGDTFLNAIEDGGDTYYLYLMQYNLVTDQINTYEVTDYIRETFNTSEELKAFVAENKSKSFFYTSTDETFTRKVN
jgi:hypothetical protein